MILRDSIFIITHMRIFMRMKNMETISLKINYARWGGYNIDFPNQGKLLVVEI